MCIRDRLTSFSRTVDVKLSSEPVPVLGWLTTGTLEVGQNAVKFTAPNVRYPDQEWVYEDGAVILVQDGVSVMRSSPPMVTVRKKDSDTLEVWVTRVEVDGDDSLSGSGTATVKAKINEMTETGGSGTEFEITVTTDHLDAWEQYFNEKNDSIHDDFGEGVSTVERNDLESKVTLRITGKKSDETHDVEWNVRVFEVGVELM